MSRPKRSSRVLETSRQRFAGLKKITPKPDFGPALKQEDYESEINGFSDDQDAYNGEVAALDERQNLLNAREERLDGWNSRILGAVRAQYGPDSNEYELVGGIRRSERKKRGRKSSKGSRTTGNQSGGA